MRHLIALCLTLLSAGYATAQPLRPSFESLPKDTLIVARSANPTKLLNAMRADTKLGSVLFSRQRWDRMMTVINEQEQEEFKDLKRGLGKVGLTLEDLPKMLTGDFGYAIAMSRRADRTLHDDGAPLMVGLVWLNPGEEMAGKFMAAMGKAIEIAMEGDDPFKPRRTDIEIDDHKVIQLRIPFTKFEEEWDADADDDMLFNAQRLPRTMLAMQDVIAPPAGTTSQIDQINMFVTRIGGRVLIGHTFPQNETAHDNALAMAGDDVDFDKVSATEQAAAKFAQFLKAHHEADENYAAYINATPGLAATKPRGLQMFEFIGDLRPLWAALRHSADAEDQEAIEAMRVIKTLGLDSFGVMNMHATLDGQIMRVNGFIASPKPRRGLGLLFNQRPLQPRPKAWVPANVVEYAHVSFDLGEAFALVKRLLVAEFGDDMKQGFDQADLMFQNAVQANVETTLSSIGHEHVTLRFPSKSAVEAEQINPADEDRVAIVWQPRNVETFRLVMAQIGIMQMQFGEALKQVSEQGFDGWRLDTPTAKMALMLGKQYLMLAVGSDVTAQVLTMLRKPPPAKDALIHSALVARAARIMDFKPGLAFSVSDSGRMFDDALPTLRKAVDELLDLVGADDAEAGRFVKQMIETMPEADQLKGSFDVGGSHLLDNEHGVVLESFVVMPEP